MMSMGKLMTFFSCAAMVLVLSSGTPSTSTACDTYCLYKKVTTYVCKQVPYRICVTRYDDCGRPYHVYMTKYRTVEVPVITWVKIGDE